jgi:hypothetical protein
MYYKLIKCTPVEYGNDLREEIAVADKQTTLIKHLRAMLGHSINDSGLSFEQEFGYISKRPSTEPYYHIDEVPKGIMLITQNDI